MMKTKIHGDNVIVIVPSDNFTETKKDAGKAAKELVGWFQVRCGIEFMIAVRNGLNKEIENYEKHGGRESWHTK